VDHLQRPAQAHPRPSTRLRRRTAPHHLARAGHHPVPRHQRITEVVATEITRQANPPR
jgi:hypothetical protein